MATSLLYPFIALGGAGLVVAIKIFIDNRNPTTRFKYDKVTDLRLKRKSYNDLKYKTEKNNVRSTKGI